MEKSSFAKKNTEWLLAHGFSRPVGPELEDTETYERTAGDVKEVFTLHLDTDTIDAFVFVNLVGVCGGSGSRQDSDVLHAELMGDMESIVKGLSKAVEEWGK